MIKTLALPLRSSRPPHPQSRRTRKSRTADFAGTWNIEVMSHQIALVDRAGRRQQGHRDDDDDGPRHVAQRRAHRSHADARRREDRERTAQPRRPPITRARTGPPSTAKPIIVTLQEDGTIAGEMMTNDGPGEVDRRKADARRKG